MASFMRVSNSITAPAAAFPAHRLSRADPGRWDRSIPAHRRPRLPLDETASWCEIMLPSYRQPPRRRTWLPTETKAPAADAFSILSQESQPARTSYDEAPRAIPAWVADVH